MWALVDIGLSGGIAVIIMAVVWSIRYSRDNKPVKPHDYAHDEEFQKYIEEESAKVHEYYNKVKADWEKEYGRSWDE